MKEKDIWLSVEELQHMLHGSLQWTDIALHVNKSNTVIRKLGEPNCGKQSALKTERVEIDRSKKKEHYSKRLEGQPVIWLIGSVGFLTLSSWFYFVLFSK